MKMLSKTLVPIFLLFFAFSFVDTGISVDFAEAKSFKGGKMFKMSPKKAPPRNASPAQGQGGSSFGRGLAGGLLGGALGGMLFGSMFGAGGSGMGILPLLLLGGVAYFLYRKFSRPQPRNYQSYQQAPQQSPIDMFGTKGASGNAPPPPPPTIGGNLLEEGLEQIRETDRDFDTEYFKQVASDVFFQVQAGWMRRDLDSYRHLLGEQLAQEYAGHFADMRAKGQINKLESIAVRSIELVEAGSDGSEDFITVLFTASLLDYTVDDKSGEVVDGSDSTPVKFEEKWTWARPTGSQDWKLEGIHDS